MNFPHYIGFQILEKSKYRMYHIIYENIYPKLHIYRPIIIYSDTDSIIMAITIQVNNICKNTVQNAYMDFLKAIEKISDILDTSNMHPHHPCYNNLKKMFLEY